MTNLTKQEQSGRSMVEMLGVLAVIGVLAITGISGYTTAMNKYRANEILNAASKRAVVVSTQLQSGRTNPTLAEFGTDNTVGGATFSTELETQGTDKFVIKFTSDGKPSAEIWAQMQNIAGTSGIVRSYESGQTGLVYNNDLTTTARASDYNNQGSDKCGTGNTYCAGSGLCLEGTGKTCTCSDTRPACKKCSTAGSYVVDTSKNNTRDTCAEGQVCDNGVCKVQASASSYTNQTDCVNANYYWFDDDNSECGVGDACYATYDEIPVSICSNYHLTGTVVFCACN